MHIGAWWCTSIIAEYCTPSAFPLLIDTCNTLRVCVCVCVVESSASSQAIGRLKNLFHFFLSSVNPVNVRKFLGENRAKLQEFKQKKCQWTIILSQQIFCSSPLEELIACDRTLYLYGSYTLKKPDS